MENIISRLVRFVIKMILAAFGLVFAISLLLAALVILVVSLLKALITGKKPAPVMVFSRFRQFAPGSMWPNRGKPENTNDVVDVEVREVKPDTQRLKSDHTSP